MAASSARPASPPSPDCAPGPAAGPRSTQLSISCGVGSVPTPQLSGSCADPDALTDPDGNLGLSHPEGAPAEVGEAGRLGHRGRGVVRRVVLVGRDGALVE